MGKHKLRRAPRICSSVLPRLCHCRDYTAWLCSDFSVFICPGGAVKKSFGAGRPERSSEGSPPPPGPEHTEEARRDRNPCTTPALATATRPYRIVSQRPAGMRQPRQGCMRVRRSPATPCPTGSLCELLCDPGDSAVFKRFLHSLQGARAAAGLQPLLPLRAWRLR